MRVIKDKTKTPGSLKKIISRLKKRGKKIAFSNGCFDIIHSGHVDYLEKAKKLSDILIVALNSDASVKRIKGPLRPINTLKNRMNMVAALESVDFVTYFNQNTPLEIIKYLKPDLLIKGGDWKKNKVVGKDIVASYGGRTLTLPFRKGQSTSRMIERIGKISRKKSISRSGC